MATKLIVQISKKIPGPQEYSSVQASCSIEGEVIAGQDPIAESERLYAQAEAVVDRQLGIAVARTAAVNSGSAGAAPPQQPRPAPGAPPYPSAGARRAPAQISAAQLRFLRQLLDRTPSAQERILAEHRIQVIEALSSRAASAVIDQLKAASP